MKKSVIAVSAVCGLLLLPCAVSPLAASAFALPASVPPVSSRDAYRKDRNVDLTEIIGYDVIGKTRFLRTMARDFYGNPEFWPYIYMENGELGDPNRIVPGTPVRVPRLSKYGVDSKNPADLEKAIAMGKEIYARYGK